MPGGHGTAEQSRVGTELDVAVRMRTSTLLGSALVATALVGISTTASAESYRNRYDREVGFFSLGAAFNYGIWTGDGDVNPFGPAIGVRGGVTLAPGLYLGADFDYFFGESRSAGVSGAASTSSRVNVYDVLGEVGYDFWLHRNGVLRPKIGLGVGVGKGSLCGEVVNIGGCSTSSRSGFAIAPGAEYMHYFSNVFLSFEARYETISLDGPDPSAVILGVGLGVAL
jgi:hypothetical protein